MRPKDCKAIASWIPKEYWDKLRAISINKDVAMAKLIAKWVKEGIDRIEIRNNRK
jgi:hypothetical protein